MTLSSVLHEPKDWLAMLPSLIDFIDPEVAQGPVKDGIRFGYLHLISDNVAEKYGKDSSKERVRNVLVRRSRLYEPVQKVLEHHLSSSR